eukprot:scaffold80855_cov60-Phaeocystis_antarctica.AAC.2
MSSCVWQHASHDVYYKYIVKYRRLKLVARHTPISYTPFCSSRNLRRMQRRISNSENPAKYKRPRSPRGRLSGV